MSVIKYGNETVNPVVQVINGSNPNLLDNPWFTVNQRGKSEYTEADYTVDRWRLQNRSGNAKFEVIPDSNNSRWITTENDDGLFQPVEPLTIGETYTISFNSGYKIFTATFIWEGTDIIKLYDGAQTTNFAVIHDSTRDLVYPYVRYAGLASKSIKAVKLELGSVSTLYLDSAPDYREEVMKCCTSTADPNDTYANKKTYDKLVQYKCVDVVIKTNELTWNRSGGGAYYAVLPEQYTNIISLTITAWANISETDCIVPYTRYNKQVAIMSNTDLSTRNTTMTIRVFGY